MWGTPEARPVPIAALNRELVGTGFLSALELGYAAAYLHARRHWHVQPSMLTHIMQGPLPPRQQSRSALRFNAHHVNGELLPTVAHAERHVRRSVDGGARVCRQLDAGGLTNYGQELHATHLTWKIGTMVAANSGKPGGACGGEQLQFDKLHAGHHTQEEDIISNWLLTGAHNSLCSAEDDVKNFCVQRFKGAVQRKWGVYSTDG